MRSLKFLSLLVCLLISQSARADVAYMSYDENPIASGWNEVIVVDTDNGVIQRRIIVGQNPIGVAVTSDGSLVFVANSGSDNVSVIGLPCAVAAGVEETAESAGYNRWVTSHRNPSEEPMNTATEAAACRR